MKRYWLFFLICFIGCSDNESDRGSLIGYDDICANAKKDVSADYSRGNYIWTSKIGLDKKRVDLIERELGFNFKLLSGISLYDSCYEFYSDSFLYSKFEKTKEDLSLEVDSILYISHNTLSEYQYSDGIFWYFDSIKTVGTSEVPTEFDYVGLLCDSFKVKMSIVVDTNGFVSECDVIRRYDLKSTSLIEEGVVGANFKKIGYLFGNRINIRLAPVYIMLRSPPSTLTNE